MSQYGFYCYHSCQIWHWSIVCLSMDSILIIAVSLELRLRYCYHTGVLYVSVWILFLLLYCIASRSGHWSIVCLSMDSIVIIAVRSGTGVLYVSVWILLLS